MTAQFFHHDLPKYELPHQLTPSLSLVMRATKTAKALPLELDQTQPTVDEQKALLEEAIRKRDKLADSELEMARMFIEKGKPDIAKRRLREILDAYGESAAATEARKLMKRV